MHLRGGSDYFIYYYHGGFYVRRLFPLTDNVRAVLQALKAEQKKYNITSEYVFCNFTGNYTTTVAYRKSLYKVTKYKLNLKLHNNHAFRMALNSYELIPAGIQAPDRARILGHSVEVNLKYYTFAKSDEHIAEVGEAIDRLQNMVKKDKSEGVTRGHHNLVSFQERIKA